LKFQGRQEQFEPGTRVLRRPGPFE
jgi:hypothetical protein